MGINKPKTILKSKTLFIIGKMSGEAIAFKMKNKINNKPKFLHCKNSFLTPALGLLICDA